MEQINMPVLPLGLAYVAAAMDKQGHTVKVLNLMMQTDTHKALHSAIDEFNHEKTVTQALPGRENGCIINGSAHIGDANQIRSERFF